MSAREEAAVLLGPGREFDLIRRLAGDRPISPGVVVGPGDDCAVLEGGLVLTCDLSVEGVHFRRSWLEPSAIGYRAAMAALSDLAAMAATPLAVLVAYALPAADGAEIAPALQEGIEEACRAVGAPLVGGDVTRSSGPLVLDLVALGRARDPVLRRGARPGDELWVTGWLGGAAAAVALLSDGRDPPSALLERYARPRARVAEALWLSERVTPSALIDLSDGLAGDAAHLAAASGVSVVLEAGAIPVDRGVADALPEEGAAFAAAAGGGEDYELLLACPPGAGQREREAFEESFGLPLTRVGRVVDEGEHPVLLEWPDGSTAPPRMGGFDHFGAEAGPGAAGGAP